MDLGRAREEILRKKEEEALRSKMKARALKECKTTLTAFAECARGRTISVVWACKAQSREMNECLHQYTNDEVFEQQKQDYMNQRRAQNESE
ncbi:hypothetical protein KFL_005190090 [Klebsormidium nitens]|uniref:COX assembly mitochondrial protein n=1 Tax=Klebsormidium nitens TaxID=105231 RepID=A0A1Y1ILA7_KLENI|nr:hypothetical protein KFL_005190090 [Klebsormidium nitens]|eukprot:GAQ89417.1 hypothetical protein KFL_005190090 [Klebsormidium nitens]